MPKVDTRLPRAKNSRLGIVVRKLEKLGAAMSKLEGLENGSLVSPRLEGGSFSSSSGSVSWSALSGMMNLYGVLNL